MDQDIYKFKIKNIIDIISSLDNDNSFLSIDNNKKIIENIKAELDLIHFKSKNNYSLRKSTIQSLVFESSDDIEFKKLGIILNESFWEARSYVSKKNIKYPSAYYEKCVKEYQNQFLIDKYNMSLEDIEFRIYKYKEKYSVRLYIDSVYDRALNCIRDKYTLSIDEICDEKNGLSLIDSYVKDILLNDLERNKNNLNSLLSSFSEINKYEIKKLEEKIDVITKQIELINKRELYLEKKGD